MTIRPMTSKESPAARELFNQCVRTGEVLYKPFASQEDFDRFFLHRDEEDTATVALCAEEGFAAGCYTRHDRKAYVAFAAVRPDCRRKGCGTALLAALEEALTQLSGGEVKTCEISFFDPMNFTWLIPGTGGHDHPNAPGADVGSGSYIFLKNCGYRDFAYQNSYHIGLEDYRFPADIRRRIESLGEKGIRITLYDPARHTGLEELMDDLNNDLWRKEILGNAALPGGGKPLLIVDRGGRAMGFAGPLAVQESGRGYFAGIAVHSACRGSGAGKVLFSHLCSSLGEMGARYMTLFTGEQNPARNIYEAAGFRIVRTWADMRKTVR